MKKAVIVLLLVLPVALHQTPATASDRTPMIVRLAPGGTLAELHARVGSFPMRAHFHMVNAMSVSLTSQQRALLARDPLVRGIEPERTFRIDASAARATYGVTKAASDFGMTGDRDGVPRTYSSRDVVACVIDTGIDASHVDLDQGQVIGWKDLINGRARPYDDNGHGTHVSAIIAGQGDGNAAYRGVAPGAALVGVKAIDSTGMGSSTTILSALQWCVDRKATYNIRIINMSFGSAGPADGTDALSEAVNGPADRGILPVVAAGNDGPARATVGIPGAAAKALTVCSVSDPGVKGFVLSSFSSRGPTSDGRMKPDVCGPGQSITASRANTGNGYVTSSGTSMSAPFVAGVTALMLDVNNTLTPARVKSMMMATAVDWANPGIDAEAGAGRLQAYEAIKRAGSFTGTGPAVPSHFESGGSLRAKNAVDRFSLRVTSTGWPIAVSFVIPGASSTKDFDMMLLAPNGTVLATSNSTSRQETIGVSPSVTGTYTLVLTSYAGAGGYILDFSYWGTTPVMTADG